MRMRHRIAAASLLALAPAAVSAQAARASAEAKAASAEAQRFADAYVPAMTADAGAAAFRAAFTQNFDSVPANVELEKRYPGSRAIGQAAGEKEMRAFYARALPPIRAALAARVDPLFSGPELVEVTAFLTSSTGQKIIGGVAQGAAAPDNALVKEAAETGRVEITRAKLEKMLPAAVIAGMTQEEVVAMIRFSQTSAFAKFNAQSVALSQFVADQTASRVREAQPQIGAAISKAIGDHVAAAKP